MTMRTALLVLLCTPLWALAQPGASLDERVNALSAELRCVVCQNQSLADSQAELAQDMKREVRSQLAAGRSEAQVVDFMVQRYGDFVRYRPALQPSTWLLWVGPLLGLLAGAVVLARRLRHTPEDPHDLNDADRLTT
jgi:cytochrome c-type biogenesis protein CcmH